MQVDCTPNPLHCGGTGGCVGAIPQLAFTYASLFGLVRWTDIPNLSTHLRPKNKPQPTHEGDGS